MPDPIFPETATMKLRYSLTLATLVLLLDWMSKRWVESILIFGDVIELSVFFKLVLSY